MTIDHQKPLNFPSFPVRTKFDGDKMLIFDSIRKKYVALTPEEWVRQHLIHYLICEKQYPASLISVEMPLKFAQLLKRSDVVIFNRNGEPLMIVECKAPDVTIAQKVFEQISIYNMTIRAVCLMVTNGINHYCLSVPSSKKPSFLKEIPAYSELIAISRTA